MHSSLVSAYEEELFHLFHQPSEDKYGEVLQEKKLQWDAKFEEYYMKHIHPQVLLVLKNDKLMIYLQVSQSIGRWVLEGFHCYHPLPTMLLSLLTE